MAKPTPLPTTPDGLSKEAARLRTELRQARLDHTLQKLSSPAKLRSVRRQLARVLTLQTAQSNLSSQQGPSDSSKTVKQADKPGESNG